MMRSSYLMVFAFASAGLAACATTPPPAPTSDATFATTLRLCDGDHIDNAPATDSSKRILGYRPLTNVKGVTLARAPVQRACFSSGFGRRHDRAGNHNGIDLSTKHGHAVYASADGVIEEMRVAGDYGKMILIRHNSRVQSRYGHLSSYGSEMHVGHDVRQGDLIAKTGKTGNANAVILHYEIIVDGAPRDPMTVGE